MTINERAEKIVNVIQEICDPILQAEEGNTQDGVGILFLLRDPKEGDIHVVLGGQFLSVSAAIAIFMNQNENSEAIIRAAVDMYEHITIERSLRKTPPQNKPPEGDLKL